MGCVVRGFTYGVSETTWLPPGKHDSFIKGARWDILLPPPHACLFFQQPTRDEILLFFFFWRTSCSIRADNDTKPVVVVTCTQEQNENLVSDDYRKLRKRRVLRSCVSMRRVCAFPIPAFPDSTSGKARELRDSGVDKPPLSFFPAPLRRMRVSHV